MIEVEKTQVPKPIMNDTIDILEPSENFKNKEEEHPQIVINKNIPDDDVMKITIEILEPPKGPKGFRDDEEDIPEDDDGPRNIMSKVKMKNTKVITAFPIYFQPLPTRTSWG